MKKLLLINPTNTFIYNDYYEPHALGVLCALTPKNLEIELIDENVESFKFMNADLVAITSYTSNINRAYDIAKLYMSKSTPVILGGVHASLHPEEAANYVTSVAIGSAESIWGDIIKDFLTGTLKSIYTSTNSVFVIPDRSYYKVNYKVNIVETSRGCCFSCDFCSVQALYNNKTHQRQINDVIDELIPLNGNIVFFSDDNIFGYSDKEKGRFKELCKEIIKHKINIYWIGYATINIAEDKNAIDLASKSEYRLLMIGFESDNSIDLFNINKKNNTKYSKIMIKKFVSYLHKKKIAIIGGFIYGFMDDDNETINRRRRYIKELNIDIVSYVPLLPLPKTRTFNVMYDNKQLIYDDFPKDWEKYNFTNFLFRHKILKHTDIEVHKKINGSLFYNKFNFLKSIINTFIRTKSPKTTKITFQFIRHNYNPKLKKIKILNFLLK